MDKARTRRVINPTEISTGDLVGISYRNLFGYFISAWSNSHWSHTGIAYRNNTGQLYIIEAAAYRQGYNGVFCIPFEQWLEINHRHDLCWLKYHGPGLSGDVVWKEFNKLRQCALDSYDFHWYRFLVNKPYIPETIGTSSRPYACFEFTIMLLQNLGIIQKTKSCSSYFPGDIINRNFSFESGRSYDMAIGLL